MRRSTAVIAALILAGSSGTLNAFSLSWGVPAPVIKTVTQAEQLVQAIKNENWKEALTVLARLNDGSVTTLKKAYLQQQISYLQEDLQALRDASSPRLLPHLYLNIGCGYHNLYLWVREREGRAHEPFFQKAQFSYELSYHSDFDGSYAVSRVCLAALYMEQGMVLAASELMEGLDLSKLDGYIEQMNLAYYYSASGQTNEALAYLTRALSMRPTETREWASWSNDFDHIRNDARFKALMSQN